LLDDIGDDHEDDDEEIAAGSAEAETYQPFQSFSPLPTANSANSGGPFDRNEADVDREIISEEQMNNERNNALTNNSDNGRRRNNNNSSNNDDDDALLLADDFDDGPVINAFAFNDEPPMIIA